jgi:hypothetical protein
MPPARDLSMTADQAATLERYEPLIRGFVARYEREGGPDPAEAESRYRVAAARAVLTWRPDGGACLTTFLTRTLRLVRKGRNRAHQRKVRIDPLDRSPTSLDAGLLLGDGSRGPALADLLGRPDDADAHRDVAELRARLERWAAGIGRHFPDTLAWLLGDGAAGGLQQDAAAARGLSRHAFNERVRAVRAQLAKDLHWLRKG